MSASGRPTTAPPTVDHRALTPPSAGVVRGSCHHDCPDTCVWEVTVDDGRAVRLRGSRDHPTTRGQLCPKVNRFIERVYHPDRVLQPLRRTGPKGSGRFEPISWDDAIAEVAGRLDGIRRTDGPAAILPFSFDGTQGVIQKGIMAERFFAALGTSDLRRHLCGVTAWLGASDVLGTPMGIEPQDLRFSRTILLWGTDTYVTNRHLWPFIDEARANGATVVVIDPVRSATAQRADIHLAPRPGTDVALVLAMIHVMDAEELLDRRWLDEHTSGWDELRRSARAMTPATAETITTIDAERIVEIARRFATEQPSVVRSLVGPEHRRHGREIMRAIALLPSVTGAWRHRGGGLARSTQVYFEEALNYPDPGEDDGRRRFNMARLGRVLNDTTLDPPIQALVVHNSNPAVICPDQNAVIAGLERDDLFTVVIEQFMTDTARRADIVLPATTQLEHLDLGIAWGHLHLSLNRPAIAPVGEALPNTEIFRRLARALALDDPDLADDDETLIRHMLDTDHPWLSGITFERLVDETWCRLAVPEGHRPTIDRPPDTPDGRLRLGAIEHHEPMAATDDRHPLTVLSRKRHIRFLNANYGGFDEHLPGDGRPTVQIHPADAAARVITTGDDVVVHNDRGRLTLVADVSEDVPPGTVVIGFGWWGRSTPEDRGVNALTTPDVPDDDQGSAAFHDTRVEVELRTP
ncbi:MAG: molybdopterin-dependent oxidoreductase [Actinomycetota bacterium]